MDRKEFCALMAKAKQESGIRISDISFNMKMLLPSLRRFEKGEHNFNFKKVMEYLQAINSHIQIDKVTIANYESLLLWLVDVRKTHSLSQRALAKKIECAPLTIANVERKATIISIDTLLKIVDVLGYDIKIENNDSFGISSKH